MTTPKKRLRTRPSASRSISHHDAAARPRAMWTGVLGFGLVSIPVRLMPASRATEGLPLHLLHAEDHGRIHNKRVCEVDGAEVPWSQIVHGYEYERGRYAVVTDADLAKLRPASTQTVEILQFCDASDVDPMLYDRPYYVAPEKRGKHAYALLRSTLEATGKVGIARIVLRTREHLAALEPHGEALVLVLLRYADELLGDEGLELPPRSEQGTEAECRMARTLLDEMTESFDIHAFHDTHHRELEKLLAKRARGEKVPRSKRARRPTWWTCRASSSGASPRPGRSASVRPERGRCFRRSGTRSASQVRVREGEESEKGRPNMAMMINTGGDVISFLKTQHEDIKALLERVSDTHGAERTQAFVALRRTLAVHETAEEEIVHPAARRAIPGGDAVVDARLEEEEAAKRALTDLETLDLDSPEFDARFGVLRVKIVAHAVAEERDEFARLATTLDGDRLARMQKAAVFAEAVAPTRPHPGIESAAANMLAGPFLSMLDRVRDSLSTKSKT